ncbi:MAG: CidA/LrgA family protein [Halomonadaceae bacterium]|nr:MAG: CidA/LrgA family protein [Halomonadaceae bacterium]
MLKGLTVLLLFQLAGLALGQIPGMPVPGAILGMVLFFGYLVITDGGGESEQKVGKILLDHLPLFFIPAGVGVITLGAIIKEQALPLILALTLATLVAFVVTALLMQWLLKRAQRNES